MRAAFAGDGVTLAPSVRVDPAADCSLALHPQLSFEESAAASGEVAVTYCRASYACPWSVFGFDEFKTC